MFLCDSLDVLPSLMQWLPAEPDITESDGGIVFRYRYGRAPAKRMHNFFRNTQKKETPDNSSESLIITDMDVPVAWKFTISIYNSKPESAYT